MKSMSENKEDSKIRTPMRSAQSIERELTAILDEETKLSSRTCVCTDERMMLHYNLAEP